MNREMVLNEKEITKYLNSFQASKTNNPKVVIDLEFLFQHYKYKFSFFLHLSYP